MKTYDIYKSEGRVLEPDNIHLWLDRQLKYITNGQFTLSLARKVTKRSLAQNRLMWLWFACLEHETGQPAMDFHDHYCIKFLAHDFVDPATGVVERVGGHTSELSKDAFAEFLNKVQADAAEWFGITLPSPDDICFQDFYNEYNRYVQ